MSNRSWCPDSVCLDCRHAFEAGSVAVCPMCGASRLAHVSVRYTKSGDRVEGRARAAVLRALSAAYRGQYDSKPKPRAPSARERWAAQEASR